MLSLTVSIMRCHDIALYVSRFSAYAVFVFVDLDSVLSENCAGSSRMCVCVCRFVFGRVCELTCVNAKVAP